MENAKLAESKDETETETRNTTKDLGNELANCGMQYNIVFFIFYRPQLKHYQADKQTTIHACGTRIV